MTYTIARNPQFNSLEIAFDGKPAQARPTLTPFLAQSSSNLS